MFSYFHLVPVTLLLLNKISRFIGFGKKIECGHLWYYDHFSKELKPEILLNNKF